MFAVDLKNKLFVFMDSIFSESSPYQKKSEIGLYVIILPSILLLYQIFKTIFLFLFHYS